MTVPAFPRLATAGDQEQAAIEALVAQLTTKSHANSEAEGYYDGSHVETRYGISIPPTMQNADVVAGWGGTVVDVLEERLDWQGWSSDDQDLGLGEVFTANALDVDSGMAHLDSLIFGLSFVTVGSGIEGEPSPLVTAHSPKDMTGAWDRRSRRLSSALSWVKCAGSVEEVTLYLPDETAVFHRRSGSWVAVDRDRHNLGRVPVVVVPNRARASREIGRSEITKAVRYYTDAACRTLLGLEVNREFYNAPQRVGLNIDESMFQDPSGNPVSQWTSIMGRLWNVPPNDDGQPAPDVKQFSPASPAPYIDQVKGYATLLAAEAGIPGAYLGFHTDNPSSADAIRAGEARLVKRAERRQSVFGRAWMEVGKLSLLVRDGAIPDRFDLSVSSRWRDAATPTRAASADEATKLIGAGVLSPDSSITYDRVGLTPAEQRQIESDKRRSRGTASIAGLGALTGVEDAQTLKAKFDAMGVAIRSGVDPKSAATQLGLGDVVFTGATPASLRLPEVDAAGLEDK